MPGTLEAAIVFTLVIAPGYLFVRGFSVGRTHIAPGPDLYVLAQAIVASVVWLAVVYVGWRMRIASYGLVPPDNAAMERHGVAIARMLLAVVLLPYFVGRLAGLLLRLGARLLDALAGRLDAYERLLPSGKLPWSLRVLRDAIRRLIAAPTAWDLAWTTRSAANLPVTIHLKEGGVVRGLVDQVDLSPLPHQVLLKVGDGFDADGAPQALASGDRGVYIEGTEIRAVFFD